MLLVILAIYFGYKKGKDSGRNPFLWAFICAAVFIGLQFVTSMGVGFIMGLGIATLGWPETIYEDYTWGITIASIVVSIIGLLLVFRYLDKIPDEPFAMAPPPPPSFEEQNIPRTDD
jgi:cytochrome c biogenesis protein CcdA